jgi:hypothetical protein
VAAPSSIPSNIDRSGSPGLEAGTGHSTCSPFASRTVTRHLLRGAAGLLLLLLAIGQFATQPVVAVAAAGAAVVALRGCPMCWTVGLIETVASRLRVLANR